MPQIFYSAGPVVVTDKRVTIGGVDYSVRNISSVGIYQKVTPKRTPWPMVAVSLVPLSFCALEMLESKFARNPLMAALYFFAAVLFIGLGIYFRRPGFVAYSLVFDTNGGKAAAYSSKNEQEMIAIKAAINRAIDAQAETA